MKIIKDYIHGKMVDNMLNDENFIPIYNGDYLVDFVYRKVEE